MRYVQFSRGQKLLKRKKLNIYLQKIVFPFRPSSSISQPTAPLIQPASLAPSAWTDEPSVTFANKTHTAPQPTNQRTTNYYNLVQFSHNSFRFFQDTYSDFARMNWLYTIRKSR